MAFIHDIVFIAPGFKETFSVQMQKENYQSGYMTLLNYCYILSQEKYISVHMNLPCFVSLILVSCKMGCGHYTKRKVVRHTW